MARVRVRVRVWIEWYMDGSMVGGGRTVGPLARVLTGRQSAHWPQRLLYAQLYAILMLTSHIRHTGNISCMVQNWQRQAELRPRVICIPDI